MANVWIDRGIPTSDARAVYLARQRGESLASIGRRYGVCRESIKHVVINYRAHYTRLAESELFRAVQAIKAVRQRAGLE